MLHRDQRQVHSDSQCQTLASGFSQLFIDKLVRICQSIAVSLLQSRGQVFSARLHTEPTLSLLTPTSAAEVKAADIEALQVIAGRRASVSPATFVCYQLCANHITHGQPVVRRVQFPSGVQDSTGAAFAQED